MKKRRWPKTLLWLVVGGIGVLILVAILLSQPKGPYEGNYWDIVTNPNGVPNANIRDIYGEPKEITIENGKVYAKYDGVKFLLSTDDPKISDDNIFRSIQSVIVTDPRFRFGSKKIGVGSTREEVEKTYKDVTKNIDVDCGYHDGDMGVDFFFDENDKVKKILIGMWP